MMGRRSRRPQGSEGTKRAPDGSINMIGGGGGGGRINEPAQPIVCGLEFESESGFEFEFEFEWPTDKTATTITDSRGIKLSCPTISGELAPVPAGGRMDESAS